MFSFPPSFSAAHIFLHPPFPPLPQFLTNCASLLRTYVHKRPGKNCPICPLQMEKRRKRGGEIENFQAEMWDYNNSKLGPHVPIFPLASSWLGKGESGNYEFKVKAMTARADDWPDPIPSLALAPKWKDHGRSVPWKKRFTFCS